MAKNHPFSAVVPIKRSGSAAAQREGYEANPTGLSRVRPRSLVVFRHALPEHPRTARWQNITSGMSACRPAPRSGPDNTA